MIIIELINSRNMTIEKVEYLSNPYKEAETYIEKLNSKIKVDYKYWKVSVVNNS